MATLEGIKLLKSVPSLSYGPLWRWSGETRSFRTSVSKVFTLSYYLSFQIQFYSVSQPYIDNLIGALNIFHNFRRRSSTVGSVDSGGSEAGGLVAGGHHCKTKYRVLVMGNSRVGKTSIISQFLYDQFSTNYKVIATKTNQCKILQISNIVNS